MKADILDLIDQALTENRHVKRRRMQAHVMWLCDNPTQMAITYARWDHTTTTITDQDLNVSAMISDMLWRFREPAGHVLCVRCNSCRVDGDQLHCAWESCEGDPDTTRLATPAMVAAAGVGDLPQPLHRGRVHARPMVEGL